MTPSSAPPTRANQASTTARSVVAGLEAAGSPPSETSWQNARAGSAVRAARDRRFPRRFRAANRRRDRKPARREREHLDAARGRMDALLYRIERQRSGVRNDQFAVERETVGLQRFQRGDDFTENNGSSGCPFFDVIATASPSRCASAPETVPLRLVLPIRAIGNRLDEERISIGAKSVFTCVSSACRRAAGEGRTAASLSWEPTNRRPARSVPARCRSGSRRVRNRLRPLPT